MPVIPGDNDVLFGRGSTIQAHPGNVLLRFIVQAHKSSFLAAKKKEKRNIARRIVNEFKGRFLIEDDSNNIGGVDKSSIIDGDGISNKVWKEVETEKAVDKVMHRFREKVKQSAAGPSGVDEAQQQALIQQQEVAMSRVVDPPPVSAATQLASNPELAGLVSGGGGVQVQSGLMNNLQQPQQQLQQLSQQPQELLNSAEDLDNFLQSMQQSIDNNFMDTLASNDNLGGSPADGQQQNLNQNHQLQISTSDLFGQQLNSFKHQQQESNNNNLIQQQSNNNNLIQQQGLTDASGMSQGSCSSILTQTTMNRLQMQNMQNQQFIQTSNTVVGNSPDGISSMNQGIMNNDLPQRQQNQQCTMGSHLSTDALRLADTSCMSQGNGNIMNQSSNIDQTMNQQIQNSQQFTIQSSIGTATTMTQPNNTIGNGFQMNNNITSLPVSSNENMMNTNSQQITMGGMVHSNIMGNGYNNYNDTIGSSQQSGGSPDPNQQQIMNTMGSPILSGGTNLSISQITPVARGLPDDFSVSTSGSTSRHNSFVMNSNLGAIQEQGAAGQSFDYNPVGDSSFTIDSTSPLHQQVTTNEAAAPVVSDDVDHEDIDHEIGSFLDDLTSSVACQRQDQLLMMQGSSNQNQYSPTANARYSRHHQNQEQQHLSSSSVQEVTLQGWIDIFNPLMMRSGYNQVVSEKMLTYIKSLVIPLAIKLTEHLIEGEKEDITADGNNHVEPSSITCRNILVRVKNNTIIDEVMIDSSSRTMSFDSISNSNSNNPVVDAAEGKVPAMLFALGAVLYEVLCRESLGLNNATGSSNATSFGSLSLGNYNGCDTLDGSAGQHGSMARPSKRSSASGNSQTHHAKCIAKLESVGIPYSLCALVHNLLDSAQGDFCSDDAYWSLSDVLTDLNLMHTDPECFLDNYLPAAASNGSRNPSLEIRSKFYGREDDISKIEEAYSRHTNGGGCGGIVMSGGAGVGKSSLVSEVTKKLARQSGAYYLQAKFDQNNGVSHPLSTIGAVLNSLCDLFARDATQDQLKEVAEVLEKALGSQAALLVGVLPSLTKLINIFSSYSINGGGASNECINPAASMQFLFRKLLEALGRYRKMTFFLDDLQWADPASLLLIASLISLTKESSCIFFACCYRDDDIQEGDPFTLWLTSINIFPLEVMELKDISTECVNELVSETLHLSPRITQPLASILHHKTRGNPLFLRQLLESLRDQGYINFNLSPPRWTWDLNKIADMKLLDDVLALLLKDMQRLHPELQSALKIASCMETCVKYSTFDILSKDLNMDLRGLISQVAENGFMDNVDENRIRWAHDKVQQAAYEMMEEQERRKNHMRFGLAIISHALNDGSAESDDLLFLAINQINRGGCSVLKDSRERVMIAKLNLKAGKRSTELTDFSTALALFEHGISFLGEEQRWTTNYDTCLALFDSAVETACALNDVVTVRRLSEQVLAHAKNSDDKLNCLYSVVKSLRLAFMFIESKNIAFVMLEQMGERLPRPSDDVGLMADIQEIKLVLQNMSDDYILNLHETNQKKRDVQLMNLYHEMSYLFQFIEPKRIADVNLRSLQITLSNGLCIMSPLAFAQFAIILITSEDYALGYRLGTLSLRLLEKINAQRYTSAVIALVGHCVSWVSEPLQSIDESHLIGYNSGLICGDGLSTTLNYQFHLHIQFFTGQTLTKSRDDCREWALQLIQRKQQLLLNGVCCMYLSAVAMINGLGSKENGNGVERLPTWDAIMGSRARTHFDINYREITFSTYRYMRAFLFKMYNDLPKDGMLRVITEQKIRLRPIFIYGTFYEALVSCQLARQTDGYEYQRKGEEALIFFRNLSKRNKWNFESKCLLLEAEMMYLSGYHSQASHLYKEAIRLSHEHKFINEEAIASELAGMHFYERGLLEESCAFFSHSVECYKKWGALAISKRVEDIIEKKFGFNYSHQPGSTEFFLAPVLSQIGDSSKKRQE